MEPPTKKRRTTVRPRPQPYYECEFCNKRFRLFSQCIRHGRKEIGKEYCDRCGKWWTTDHQCSLDRGYWGDKESEFTCLLCKQDYNMEAYHKHPCVGRCRYCDEKIQEEENEWNEHLCPYLSMYMPTEPLDPNRPVEPESTNSYLYDLSKVKLARCPWCHNMYQALFLWEHVCKHHKEVRGSNPTWSKTNEACDNFVYMCVCGEMLHRDVEEEKVRQFISLHKEHMGKKIWKNQREKLKRIYESQPNPPKEVNSVPQASLRPENRNRDPRKYSFDFSKKRGRPLKPIVFKNQLNWFTYNVDLDDE